MRRSRLKLAIILVAFALLVALAWAPLRQAWNLGVLHERIGGGVAAPETPEPARYLPKFLDESLREPLQGSMMSNLELKHRVRCFRSCFDGPIHSLFIAPKKWEGDVGEVLTRFRELRKVSVVVKSISTEEQVTELCAGLRRLPRLEDVWLSGEGITDTSLAPLAGHPGIRSLTLYHPDITPGCLPTLTSLPQLDRLFIKGARHIPGKDRAAMKAALPTVAIEFVEK